MKKLSKGATLQEWVRANMEIQLLLTIGLCLIENIRQDTQKDFETPITIEDIEGIRHQQIAQKRGLIK